MQRHLRWPQHPEVELPLAPNPPRRTKPDIPVYYPRANFLLQTSLTFPPRHLQMTLLVTQQRATSINTPLQHPTRMSSHLPSSRSQMSECTLPLASPIYENPNPPQMPYPTSAPPGLLTVNHGPYHPYVNHHTQTTFCNALIPPKTTKSPPLMILKPSSLIQADIDPLYPRNFSSITSEIQPTGIPHYPPPGCFFAYNYSSPSTSPLLPEK